MALHMRMTQHKRFVPYGTRPNFDFVKTSFTLETLSEIPNPAIKKEKYLNIMKSTRQKEANEMQVGVCGICCDTCGLKTKGICQGCVAGDSPEAAKKVEFLRSINALCPVLEYAVKNKIAFCSRDWKEFPCQIFEGEFPYSKAYLGMYKSRLQQQE